MERESGKFGNMGIVNEGLGEKFILQSVQIPMKLFLRFLQKILWETVKFTLIF
jgi:hypothetical protein